MILERGIKESLQSIKTYKFKKEAVSLRDKLEIFLLQRYRLPKNGLTFNGLLRGLEKH